jgi:hypothetical protein
MHLDEVKKKETNTFIKDNIMWYIDMSRRYIKTFESFMKRAIA